MTWLCKAKDCLNGDHELKSAGTKKIIREKIGNLRMRLNKILKDNEDADDLEKLDQEELIIDLSEDKRRRHEIALKVKSHLAEIKSQNENNLKATNQIRQQHIEAMAYKFHSISDISYSPSGFSVSNFPLRSLTDGEKRVLRIVKVLRSNEIAEMQRNINRTSQKGKCWSTHLYNLSGKNPNYIFDISVNNNEKDGTKQHNNIDEDEYNDFFDVKQIGSLKLPHLLYPSLALRSNSQRITQILLLRHTGRDIAGCYNEQFMKLKSHKDMVISRVSAASERIDEITKELGCTTVFKGVSNDHDITPETYDLQKTAFIKESPDTQTNIESMTPTSQRALMEMMDATLDVKTVSNIHGALFLKKKLKLKRI